MERNNDNDYTRNTSDYEPNFILREPEDKPADEGDPRRAIDPLKEESPKATEPGTGAEGPQARHTIVEPLNSSRIRVAGSAAERAGTRVAGSNAERAGTRVAGSASERAGTGLAGSASSSYDRPTGPAGSASSSYDRPTAPQDRPTAPQDRPTAPQPSPNERPRFENPSYDDGSRMGTYSDPRTNFKTGSSASWRSGETPVSGSGSGGRKKKKKQSKPVTLSKKALGLLIAGCLLLSSLFGIGGAILGYNLYDSYHQEVQAREQQASSAAKTETAGYNLESATGSNLSVKEITALAKDSVVEIRTESVASDTWMQEYVTQGAGSGVIISKDGYIMTNNHVIDGASKIKVTTADEKEYDAELIGTDENNDVAVIKIDADNLKAATYGNSDELEVGDMAVAIGNPLGELGGTVTAGIISAKDRALSIDGKTLHLLQTDSSINPGNSGGGLFNDSGQLVGLVVAKSAGSDVEGLGFAIPVNTAANVAQQLIDKGYVSGQPSTGMTYQEGSTGGGGFGSFESMFGGQTASQVYIYSVNGNNAKKAGFKSGDIVLAIDGEEITSFNDLSAIVTSHKVGDTLTFTISRDGNEKKIKLELEEKKVSTNPEQGTDGDQSEGEGESPDSNKGNEFPAVPDDEGGSLFDYFFGW